MSEKLQSLFKLEFYKKQRNWELSRKKPRKEAHKESKVVDNSELNQTYTVEDGSSSVLNNAFFNSQTEITCDDSLQNSKDRNEDQNPQTKDQDETTDKPKFTDSKLYRKLYPNLFSNNEQPTIKRRNYLYLVYGRNPDGNIEQQTGNTDQKLGNIDEKIGKADKKLDSHSGNIDNQIGDNGYQTDNFAHQMYRTDHEYGNFYEQGDFNQGSNGHQPYINQESGNFDQKYGNFSYQGYYNDQEISNFVKEPGNFVNEVGNFDHKPNIVNQDTYSCNQTHKYTTEGSPNMYNYQTMEKVTKNQSYQNVENTQNGVYHQSPQMSFLNANAQNTRNMDKVTQNEQYQSYPNMDKVTQNEQRHSTHQTINKHTQNGQFHQGTHESNFNQNSQNVNQNEEYQSYPNIHQNFRYIDQNPHNMHQKQYHQGTQVDYIQTSQHTQTHSNPEDYLKTMLKIAPFCSINDMDAYQCRNGTRWMDGVELGTVSPQQWHQVVPSVSPREGASAVSEERSLRLKEGRHQGDGNNRISPPFTKPPPDLWSNLVEDQITPDQPEDNPESHYQWEDMNRVDHHPTSDIQRPDGMWNTHPPYEELQCLTLKEQKDHFPTDYARSGQYFSPKDQMPSEYESGMMKPWNNQNAFVHPWSWNHDTQRQVDQPWNLKRLEHNLTEVNTPENGKQSFGGTPVDRCAKSYDGLRPDDLQSTGSKSVDQPWIPKRPEHTNDINTPEEGKLRFLPEDGRSFGVTQVDGCTKLFDGRADDVQSVGSGSVDQMDGWSSVDSSGFCRGAARVPHSTEIDLRVDSRPSSRCSLLLRESVLQQTDRRTNRHLRALQLLLDQANQAETPDRSHPSRPDCCDHPTRDVGLNRSIPLQRQKTYVKSHDHYKPHPNGASSHTDANNNVGQKYFAPITVQCGPNMVQCGPNMVQCGPNMVQSSPNDCFVASSCAAQGFTQNGLVVQSKRGRGRNC